jgi:hypothetical protein
MKLYYFDHCAGEMLAIEAFLKWQQARFTRINSMQLLKFTKGKPYPVLIKEVDGVEEILAIGFYEVIEYWNKQGLCLI